MHPPYRPSCLTGTITTPTLTFIHPTNIISSTPPTLSALQQRFSSIFAAFSITTAAIFAKSPPMANADANTDINPGTGVYPLLRAADMVELTVHLPIVETQGDKKKTRKRQQTNESLATVLLGGTIFAIAEHATRLLADLEKQTKEQKESLSAEKVIEATRARLATLMMPLLLSSLKPTTSAGFEQEQNYKDNTIGLALRQELEAYTAEVEGDDNDEEDGDSSDSKEK